MLVTAGCVLPVALAVIVAVGRLLAGMQDQSEADVLDRVALAVGILWSIDLVCLLLALAINAIGPPPGNS